MKIKKTLRLPHLKGCGLFGFSGCSEIKTPRLHPLTKVSGLISDIKNFKIQRILTAPKNLHFWCSQSFKFHEIKEEI